MTQKDVGKFDLVQVNSIEDFADAARIGGLIHILYDERIWVMSPIISRETNSYTKELTRIGAESARWYISDISDNGINSHMLNSRILVAFVDGTPAYVDRLFYGNLFTPTILCKKSYIRHILHIDNLEKDTIIKALLLRIKRSARTPENMLVDSIPRILLIARSIGISYEEFNIIGDAADRIIRELGDIL